MLKYAKKNGEHTYDVGVGNSTDFYKSIGMTPTEVEQGTDGNWYDIGYAPTEPTKEEQLNALVSQYESDKAEILKYYSDAMIHGDTELMAELAEEMTALDEQYATDYEALKGED